MDRLHPLYDMKHKIYLDRNVLVLAGWLSGEHIRDLSVWCGLPTNGTFDGSPPWPEAVLLHNDRNTIIAEAVTAGQNCPLGKRGR